MWVLVVICVVLTFILAVWAQLDVFGVKLTQLIQFKRVSSDDS